jgi:gamma-glutamyltranspeptidase/glutathione hydrolase
MTIDRRQFLGSTCGLAVAGLPASVRGDEPVKARVNGQAQAAAAGNAVLASGGNAVDAAVAAALVAGVVAVPMCGIGGYGGHLVIAKPDGKITAIDFNSTSPAAAKPDMFAADEKGIVKGNANVHGWLAVGVPGTLAGLQLALDKFGTKKFPELVKPAIQFARDGFPVVKGFANATKAAKGRLSIDPGSAKLFFDKGEPLAEGAKFRNPDLADMLDRLAAKGRVDAFYTGDIAEKIAVAFRKHGGLVTAADLAAYKAVEVNPLKFTWLAYSVFTPPPTSGGLSVIQALSILKAMEWTKIEPANPTVIQSRVEALRIAWDDRLHFLGDPKHAEVPIDRLLSDKHIRQCADRVRAAIKAGKPVDATSDGRKAGGTIHLNAVDSSGMMVALTLTHGGGFGAQVTVDGLGLVLGHGMSRFDPRPGRPNSPGPGKRPLHNMCPTIVTVGDQPIMALGATGGRKIVNTVFDALAYRIGEGQSFEKMVKRPRVHTEGDLTLTLEKEWPASIVEHLKKCGYTLKTGLGATLSAIERDPKTGSLLVATR